MEFNPIGFIESPFKQKFGIPRQPGLVPEARAKLHMQSPYNRPEAFIGLEGYSHIWIQFLFHQALRDQWQPTVRPPRLGGNQRVGVFASRSPFRPNPIGLSVVKLEAVRADNSACWLELSGVDLLDGTPVLDIKPYVAYVDSIPEAESGFAQQVPTGKIPVRFSTKAQQQLRSRDQGGELERLISQLLSLDPRPAYKKEGEDRVYGIRLYDFDLQWRFQQGCAEVVELLPISAED